jgi:hypothetical protein
MNWKRHNPIWFEGPPSLAFNPSYVYLGLGVLVLCAGVLISFLLKLSAAVQITTISALTVTINILGMLATTQNKAQIIANATSSGQIAHGLNLYSGPPLVRPIADPDKP